MTISPEDYYEYHESREELKAGEVDHYFIESCPCCRKEYNGYYCEACGLDSEEDTKDGECHRACCVEVEEDEISDINEKIQEAGK